MSKKTKRSHSLKALSKLEIVKLEYYWNRQLRDPLAFIPMKEKEGLSPTEARRKNQLLGKFAQNYFKRTITRITRDSDMYRRWRDNKKIIAVGYGYGYDAKWLRKATEAGLQTWWVDVSSVAWIWATNNLQNQFQNLPQVIRVPQIEPIVVTSEIQSLLAEPEEVGLDLTSVEIWYLCRLLNCLTTRSASIVLREIGRTAFGHSSDSSKRNAVVIINALSDHNPVNTCGTSIVRSRQMILDNLSTGAGRTVQARFVEYYRYFGKRVTAMTVMVKR